MHWDRNYKCLLHSCLIQVSDTVLYFMLFCQLLCQGSFPGFLHCLDNCLPGAREVTRFIITVQPFFNQLQHTCTHNRFIFSILSMTAGSTRRYVPNFLHSASRSCFTASITSTYMKREEEYSLEWATIRHLKSVVRQPLYYCALMSFMSGLGASEVCKSAKCMYVLIIILHCSKDCPRSF